MNINQTIRGPGLGQSSATHTSARKRSFAGGLIFLSLAGGLIFLSFISLPFSIPGGNVGTAAQELVVKPAKFTFSRPLGQLYDCPRDQRHC